MSALFPGQHGYPRREHDDATFYPLSTATVTEGGGAARTVSPWVSANNRRSLPEGPAYGASGERSDPVRPQGQPGCAYAETADEMLGRSPAGGAFVPNLRDEVAS